MSAKKTQEQFIKELITIHGNKYNFDKVIYVNNRKQITVTCINHGDWNTTSASLLSGSGCPKCGRNYRYNTLEFIEKCKLIHGDKYDYSKVNYKNNHTKVEIICPIHGSFYQFPANHSCGGNGCAKCRKNYRYNTLKFIEKCKLIHGDKYDYSKVNYKNNHTKVEIICNKHGIFKQHPYHHLNGNSCPKCSNIISKISQKWLDYLGIPNQSGITREVTIKIGNKKFIVDGFDPQTNTIYEFHGDYWHGNPKIYDLEKINPINKKTFGELLENTQKRSRLLKSGGYNVVSIWETDWKKIEKELEEANKNE